MKIKLEIKYELMFGYSFRWGEKIKKCQYIVHKDVFPWFYGWEGDVKNKELIAFRIQKHSVSLFYRMGDRKLITFNIIKILFEMIL